MGATNILRWIHILTAAIWLGEVVVINLILVPVLVRLESEKRRWFMAAIFPRIFKLASVVVATVLLSGLALNLSLSGWQLDLAVTKLLYSGRWGISIMIAGSLGLVLGLFHFFAESRLEPRIVQQEKEGNQAGLERAFKHLRVIPRVGLGILAVIFLGMMYAARGL